MDSGSLKSKWTFRVNAKIYRVIPTDGDAGRVAAMFGLQDDLLETLYDDFELNVSPGQIVAVIGPSGAGKSVLLNEIAREAPECVQLDMTRLGRTVRPAAAVLRGGSFAMRLEILSRCGLAEALALITPVKHLSGGQLYRLALAKALHEAARRDAPTLVIADEFASTLDTATASVLSQQIRKRISDSSIAMILATPRVELLSDLRPDTVLIKPIQEGVRAVQKRTRLKSYRYCQWRSSIVSGNIRDYDILSPFHYLGGRPAAHKRVYVIRTPKNKVSQGVSSIAAVLVVSPPLVNVRGRNLATGGRYVGPDRGGGMALLNAEMECISRVIVHPVFRGCGLAVRLVRHAIATARSPLMEALAAMGAVHPFFEKAGMTAYLLGPNKHITRFISAAEAVGLSREALPAVAPVKKILGCKRTRAGRFLRDELDICLRRTFSQAELSRLIDSVAELCRRTARQYVYYLAQTPFHDDPTRHSHSRWRSTHA